MILFIIPWIGCEKYFEFKVSIQGELCFSQLLSNLILAATLVCMHAWVCTIAHMWRSEGNLQQGLTMWHPHPTYTHTGLEFVMPCASDSQVLGIVGVCHHACLSEQLSLSPFSFIYNKVSMGESADRKQLAQGHWVANLVFGLAFFWMHCGALASVALVAVLTR